jgi:predicted transcriptional regulator/transcriptional regulator with XRE-family HTH domain
MRDAPALGSKIKALRRRDGLTQAELARRLGISASYLNLIEGNQRALTASLLLKLAQVFRVQLDVFVASDDTRLADDLAEVFGDPLFDAAGVIESELKQVAADSPPVARAIVSLYRAYIDARDSHQAMADRLSVGHGAVANAGLPSEEVSDFIQRRLNYFAPLEQAAERVWVEARLDGDDLYGGLLRHLAARHGVSVRTVRASDERKAMRRFDPKARVLSISEVLPPRSRRFQVAHQLALLEAADAIDEVLDDARELTSSDARTLGRVAMASYFAAAVIMPYERFLEDARTERYDIELLAHRYGASFEQICHRMTTLRRPGREGVPLHLLRIDIAGNISKRFSASGIRIARFSGACPRWNVHAAFQTPGMIRVQVSRNTDGKTYFCIARTLRSDRGGYQTAHTVQAIGMGCEMRYARELVYSDGVDLTGGGAVVPVGTTCRTCEQLDCAQRAFPAMLHPLRVNENVRGVSFYAPVDES